MDGGDNKENIVDRLKGWGIHVLLEEKGDEVPRRE